MRNRDGKMGLFSCTATIIAACVGSAIFSISGMTIYFAGASAILSWIIAAVIYGLFGIVLIHLVERFPRSGGIYIFPRRAFSGRTGAILGFFSGWGYIISSIIGIGFSAIYAGIYLQAGFPSIKSPFTVSVLSCTVAAAVVLSGTGITKKIQNTLVAVLLTALATYCATALTNGTFDSANFSEFFTRGSKGSTGFISAVPPAMMAYGGSVAIAFLASEVRNPKHNVPCSLILGLGTVAAIYTVILISIIGNLPVSTIENNESARYLPLFTSVSQGALEGFPWLVKIISISAYIALLTSIMAMMQINAKAMEAISAEGLLPKSMYIKNSGGISSVTVISMTLTAIVLCAFPQWTEMLITLGAVLCIVSMSITCISSVKGGKRNGKVLALTVLALLIVCYIPDISKGGVRMWEFTAAVYLAGLAILIAGRKKISNRVSGIVVHGKGHGHTAGIPTANLQPFDGEQWPDYGVWESEVMLDGKIYRGLTNVGLRPSDDDCQTPSIETLILDFSGDIYGHEMTLSFRKFLRETRKFASLDELELQIKKDIEQVNTNNR